MLAVSGSLFAIGQPSGGTPLALWFGIPLVLVVLAIVVFAQVSRRSRG